MKMEEKITKKMLNEQINDICSKCETVINSMLTSDGCPMRCPWRSISGDFCDFIENKRKAIEECYNED